MLRLVGRILAAGLFMYAGASHAQVVISQVYGGGGNTGATYNRDFVELFNRGSIPVSLSGFTVQYASATGTGNFSVGATLPNVSVSPGQYFLVGMASGANGVPLPTIDATGTSAMSGTAGKVVLANSTSALACNGGSTPCSGAQLALIVDLVGYGGANFFEGAAPTPVLGNALSATRAGSGCTDTNQNGADFTAVTPVARNTASPLQSCGGGGLPLLAISDVSVFEGDSGTTTMTFGIGLNAPAGVGGVTVQYTTADGTATAGSDYVATSGTAAIVEGANSTTVTVTINGDTSSEADETYFLRATSATGATISDNEGLGTIQNDDVTVVSITQIQGSGLTSPLNGAVVTTEGIVTAQKFNNGFFLQTTDAEVDADPNTSEGIFVFTSTAPPATAAVGNRIRVTGTVVEFTPSTNLNQLSITEIGTVTSIQVLTSGNTLPAPIALTSADFNDTSTPGSAEKFEGMRVNLPRARVVAGSDGNITESSATASTTGVFHVVLDDVERPFREPGIGILDTFPIPAGKTPPRFDTNQERLMVRSRGQIGAAALALDGDAFINDMTGVLDYFSGTWALLPDVGSGLAVGGKTPTPVADARYEDITIGGFNLLRFFDEVNDSNGAPTLTAAAVDKRLTKTGMAICDYLKAPDILGVVEVENLRVLGLLADRINATCASAPNYVPYLVQGNDVGGINVGFLIDSRSVGLVNRVEVLEVTQYGKTTVFDNPNGTTSLLNDRPPLLLRAIVHDNNGASFQITVIVNHLRSLNGVDDTTAGSNGWPTEGDRVRNKRAQQAAFLAELVQSLQQANPGERLVLLGDFNAFEFSDGYADVMGIVRGDEVAADQVVTHIPSPITRSLIDGSELILDPEERYSYVFEGNAQTLDHVVVNEPVIMDAAAISVDHARINADFGVHHYGETGNAIRVSDHDPVRIAISVPAFRNADIAVSADAFPAILHLDETAIFRTLIRNNGPSIAGATSIAMVFDALVTPSVTAAPDGWTCAAPVQNSGSTTITCTTPSVDIGSNQVFIAEILIDSSLVNHPILRMDVAAASQTTDPENANNQSSASVELPIFADLSVQANASSGSVIVNQNANFTVDVFNFGPDRAEFASTALVFDALVVPVVVAPDGWTCAAPIQDAGTTTITCTTPEFIGGAHFDIGVATDGPQQADWTLHLAAAATSQIPDENPGDNIAIAGVQVRVFADLDAIVFTTTPTVSVDATARFTSSLINNGPATVSSAVGTFTFDALVSPVVVAPAGWSCGAPTQTTASTTVVCTAATLTPQVPSPFDISFVNDPALGKRQVNLTVALSSPFPDPFPNNNEVGAVVSLNGSTSLAVDVSAITPSIQVGQTAVFSATVTNEGPGAGNQPTVEFFFDASVVATVTAPAGWTCNASGNPDTSVECMTSYFAAGASAQFQVSFVAEPELSGLDFQMAVLADAAGNTGSNSFASATVAIAALPASDLALRMVGGPSGFIRGGSTSVHSVQLRNIGPNPVVRPVMTFIGSPPLSNVTLNPPRGWDCTRTSNPGGFEIVCTLDGTLAASAARIPFILSVVAPSAQTQAIMALISTVSSTTSSDPVPVNNSATYTVNIVP